MKWQDYTNMYNNSNAGLSRQALGRLLAKTVARSVTPTIDLCDDHTSTIALDKDTSPPIKQLRNISMILYYIAHLQFVYGLRISEVLNIQHHHISRQGFVLIKSRKGSQDRIVFAGDALDYFDRCKANKVDPFKNFNRYFVYRQYKKVGLISFQTSSSKDSVTHSL